MATVRRHGRIEKELPRDVLDQINRMYLEPGVTYDDIKAWLNEQGHNISRSAIGRYGKTYVEACRAIRQFEDQARGIVSSVDDGMPMEEAVGKMLLQKVMAAIMDGSVDITENSRLIADVARLQSSNIQLAKWKAGIEERAQKAAEQKMIDAAEKALSGKVEAEKLTPEAVFERIRAIYRGEA
ncbi:DUF3486 family protein [Desulfosarcina sp. OttesenSCG-928-B08]|nr:DUF3486 family protein [Desulfosarcina sp. OttesenSCG-928-B08]